MKSYAKITNDNKGFAQIDHKGDFQLEDDLLVEDPSTEKSRELIEMNGLKRLQEMSDKMNLRDV